MTSVSIEWNSRLFILLTVLSVQSDQLSNQDNVLEWWQEAVFYQIYPLSFYDSDGDGIGDLKGIEEKANYLNDLGIKAVWLNPIYKSPMKYFGYDIQNYTDVDPLFGTIDDFSTLIKELKSRGIRVILDFVPNHSSDKHIWFEKSRLREDPYTNYYVWADGTGPNGTVEPNNWLGIFGGSAWEWDPVRKQFYLHQFLKEQPDLNFHDKNVKKEMKDVLRFWLDLGIDGVRIDALKYLVEDDQLRDEPLSRDASAKPGYYNYLIHNYTANTHGTFDVLAEWRDVFNEYQDQDGHYRFIVVEVTDQSLDELKPYFGDDNHTLADMAFNFDLLEIKNSTSANTIKSIVINWLENTPGKNWPNWVLGNHDQHRIANRTNPELIDAFNMLNLLLKGTPFTYYGEEIGMVDTAVFCNDHQEPPEELLFGEGCHKEYNQDPSRSPMQWNRQPFAGFTRANKTWFPVNSNYKDINVEVEKQNDRSHLNVYKRALELRDESAIKHGSVEFPYVTNDVFSFVRFQEGEPAYIVLINLGQDEHQINLTRDGESSNFKFPAEGVLEVSSGNIPNKSPLAVRLSQVEFDNIQLGKYQAVAIKFEPELISNKLFNYRFSQQNDAITLQPKLVFGLLPIFSGYLLQLLLKIKI